MDDSNAWNVDRLAANNLLAELKLEATDERIDSVVSHFARHRQAAYAWAAERVHAGMIARLETASMENFASQSEEWGNGFRFAEHEINMLTPTELLESQNEQVPSAGQLMRSLIRQARNR